MVKKKKIESIKKITQQVAEKYNPQKIILFGSFAYGKPAKDSDLDLLIVKQVNKKKDLLERAYEVRQILDVHEALDILVFTPREIKERLKLNDLFIKDIFEKGKVLYERK